MATPAPSRPAPQCFTTDARRDLHVSQETFDRVTEEVVSEMGGARAKEARRFLNESARMFVRPSVHDVIAEAAAAAAVGVAA